jgi:hypothetical protein
MRVCGVWCLVLGSKGEKLGFGFRFGFGFGFGLGLLVCLVLVGQSGRAPEDVSGDSSLLSMKSTCPR